MWSITMALLVPHCRRSLFVTAVGHSDFQAADTHDPTLAECPLWAIPTFKLKELS